VVLGAFFDKGVEPFYAKGFRKFQIGQLNLWAKPKKAIWERVAKGGFPGRKGFISGFYLTPYWPELGP